MKTIFLGLAISGVLLSACGGSGESNSTGTGGASTSTSTASSGASMSTAASSGSGTGGTGPTAQCTPLPPPSGNVIPVTVADAGNLQALASNAKAGDTLLLDDGTYHLAGSYIRFATGATLRSKSGDPTKVIIDGDWQSAEVVQVAASNVTIADVTV